MSEASTLSVICPVLIGRSSPLEALFRLVDQVHIGVGQTVLIAGEAGVGKTRLVNEVKNGAVRLGFTILEGACFEPDRSLPYAPLLDLIGHIKPGRTHPESFSTLHENDREIVKLILELVNRLPTLNRSPSFEPEAEKRRIFAAFEELFSGQGAPEFAPLLMVIEDLHWSDDTSLEFLLQFTRRLVNRSILLVLTFRNDEVHPALNHFLATLDRAHLAMEFILQRLTRAEVNGMLRAIFAADRPLSAAFQQTLYTLTEGNPFFIEETLKSMLASGNIYRERGRWDHKPVSELNIPRSIHDSLQRRIESLSEEARHLLEIVSVVGRRFDFPLLLGITQVQEQELLPQIKELVAAQLVIDESADQFAFRHALTREAVYRSLLIRERKRYHRLVAETLERAEVNSHGVRVGDSAYHFYEAEAWDKTLIYSQRAGEKAQAIYEPHIALEHYNHALEASRQLGVPASGLYRARGQAYETVGEFDKAQADYAQSLQSARETHDRQAEWQSYLDLGFLSAGSDYERTGVYFRQALDLARTMQNRVTLAHSLNRLGNWNANIGDLNEALAYHHQALDIFEELSDPGGISETLDLLGMASQINGDLVHGVEYYRRAVTLFQALDDRRGLVSSLATLALCGPTYTHDPSLSPESLREAIESGEMALNLSREIGWRSGEAYALQCLSICLGPQGDYTRALYLAQQTLDISEEIEHDQWTIGGHYVLGALNLDLLELPQARQQLEQAFTLARELGSSVWIGTVAGCLASACIQQKDWTRAEAVLNEALTPETPARTQMQRLCWCARAELALARGEPDAALSIVDHLITADPNIGPGMAIPRLWKLRGEALTALQRFEEAENVLQASLSAARQQGSKSWVWRIHYSLGRQYLGQVRRIQAEEQFAAAREIIAELAASIQDQALCENFLTQTGALMPLPSSISPLRAEKERYGGLTLREREIAARLTQGKSNREIAEELVVSERTIESHVTNILTKLGFTSRTRIAIWAAEKGLGVK